MQKCQEQIRGLFSSMADQATQFFEQALWQRRRIGRVDSFTRVMRQQVEQQQAEFTSLQVLRYLISRR